MEFLRLLLPVLMAVGTSLAFDRQMTQRGLAPPNFRVDEWSSEAGRQRAVLRRTVAMGLLAFILWIGIFAPIGMIGQAELPMPQGLTIADLFLLHGVFVVGLCLWFGLGFWGSSGATAWRDQLGFGGRHIAREIGLGAAAGVAGWLGVIAILLLVALVVYFIGGEDALPSDPPSVITWIVALPIGVRLALSLSAGVVEETFFRGFLQPRIGAAFASILFVLAHLSYEQPFLLIGVALLSLLFSFLARWRQSIWAAIAAHTVFDGIQLLFVIPNAVRLLDKGEVGPVALVLAWVGRL